VEDALLRRLAALAALELSPAEAKQLSVQLDAVIARLELLHATSADARDGGDAAFAEGADVALLHDRDDRPPLRRDEPGADPLHAPPALFAPAWRDGFFITTLLPSHDAATESDP
jgi:Asp-tRNA(Asn)/Glu-tRNA(Gln) amidotransferase C subunit